MSAQLSPAQLAYRERLDVGNLGRPNPANHWPRQASNLTADGLRAPRAEERSQPVAFLTQLPAYRQPPRESRNRRRGSCPRSRCGCGCGCGCGTTLGGVQGAYKCATSGGAG